MVEHSGKAGRIDVLVRVKHYVLVNFVGDDERIILHSESTDLRKLCFCEDLSARVGGVADYDSLCALLEAVLDKVDVVVICRRN